jgi:hypothetical protein
MIEASGSAASNGIFREYSQINKVYINGSPAIINMGVLGFPDVGASMEVISVSVRHNHKTFDFISASKKRYSKFDFNGADFQQKLKVINSVFSSIKFKD